MGHFTMVMKAYVCRTFRTMTFVFIRSVQILCTQYSSPKNHQFVQCLYCYWRWSASASVALNHVRYITEAFICKCGRTRYFVQGLSVLEEDLKDLRLLKHTELHTKTHRYSISNHIGVEVRSLLMDADINRWGEWQYLKMLTFNLHSAITPSHTSFVSFFPAEFYPFSFLPSAYNVFLCQFNILLLSLVINVAFVTIILPSSCICLFFTLASPTHVVSFPFFLFLHFCLFPLSLYYCTKYDYAITIKSYHILSLCLISVATFLLTPLSMALKPTQFLCLQTFLIL